MQLCNANGAFNTFEMLLLNDRIFEKKNINNNQNQLTDSEKQQLVNLVEQYEREREREHALLYLIVEFANKYNIYLHFIAFFKDKFMINNDYSFVGDNKSKKQAFIVLNGDNTVCGPLFSVDRYERRAVFGMDDMRIKHYVDKYIEKLNRTGTFYSFQNNSRICIFE
jgi:hypothetical protein